MKRRARLQDIARELDISVATVSRALSGYPHVDELTRRRVLNVAQQIGYQPNELARALRNERTMLVGLVLPDIRSDFFASAASILQTELEGAGYRVLLGISRDDPEVDREYLLALLGHHVAGIVHVPCTPEGAQAVREIDATIPIIELNRHSKAKIFDTFTANDREGGYELGRHLLGLGHEHAAIITGSPQLSTTTERVRGFRHALVEAGMPSPPVLYGTYTQAWGHEAFAKLMSARTPPSALFVTSNQLVAGALAAAADLGVTIPDELSLVGFDEVYWYSICSPTITTYSLPLEQLGMMAAQMLLRRMEAERAREPQPPPVRCRLAGQLIVRGSAGPVATRRRTRATPARAR